MFLHPNNALRTHRRSLVHMINVAVLICDVNPFGPTVNSFIKASPPLADGSYPSDPFCTPLSVAVEQRLNPVEQHVAVQPPS